MKKFTAVIIAVIMLAVFSGCKDKGDLGAQTKTNENGVVEYNTVNAFDYSDFKKENKNSAKTEGFVNTKESECKDKSDAEALAVKELDSGFEYNTVKISYDRTEGIWRVSFSSESKTQHICIDGSGKTVLAVTE